MTERVRVLVADDHPVVREGLRLMLSDAGDRIPDAVWARMPAADLRAEVQLEDPGDKKRAWAYVVRFPRGKAPRSLVHYVTYDPATGVLEFSNAGHNWPVLLRRGADRRFLECGGTILGILENVDYQEEQLVLRPGDIVVAPYTAPTYNSVLAMAGAIVTEEGGPLCHAAVIARELGLPAVIGALGAMDLPDGATIEVDPKAGAVRVL